MANKKYKLSDSDYWETSGVYDITEGKTQREINAAKVPNTRTVNGKALSANITLSSEDIGDDSGVGGANVKASLAALKGSLNSKVIQVTIPCSSAGTFNYTVSGLTANHRLLRYQFLSGGTTETGDVLADITTTTGANSLNVVISTVYTSGSVILLFGIPTVATATQT